MSRLYYYSISVATYPRHTGQHNITLHYVCCFFSQGKSAFKKNCRISALACTVTSRTFLAICRANPFFPPPTSHCIFIPGFMPFFFPIHKTQNYKIHFYYFFLRKINYSSRRLWSCRDKPVTKRKVEKQRKNSSGLVHVLAIDLLYCSRFPIIYLITLLYYFPSRSMRGG